MARRMRLCRATGNPALFGEVFQRMKSNDPLVCMRLWMIEKVSKVHPEYLMPYKRVDPRDCKDRTAGSKMVCHDVYIFRATDEEKTLVMEIYFLG